MFIIFMTSSTSFVFLYHKCICFFFYDVILPDHLRCIYYLYLTFRAEICIGIVIHWFHAILKSTEPNIYVDYSFLQNLCLNFTLKCDTRIYINPKVQHQSLQKPMVLCNMQEYVEQGFARAWQKAWLRTFSPPKKEQS